jgi:4-aminobutyrate aminotransferase/(S)-3-amino-2-methylpropionate transaminase
LGKFCYEHGLMTITAGTNNNIMRILVPLVVTDEQFDEGLDVIEAGLGQIVEQKHTVVSHA